MKHFLGLLGALLLVSRLSAAAYGFDPSADIMGTDTNSGPADQALQQVMAEDDATMADVDGWIRDNNAQITKGGGESKEDLNRRINTRLDGVRQSYEDYLKRYPNYAPAHLAYGSFLDEVGKEDLAAVEYQTASELDPKNPAAWNDLANYFGENGQLTNSFSDYQKAIDLDPTEPVYYQNLATAVYVFRPDAMKFYHITEPQVFDKSLALYRKAIQLAPDDFELASDYAESYYGIKPLRTNDALVAWTNALSSAQTDVEREGVFIHLARIKITAGQYDEARAQLLAVTNSMYDALKNRLERNIVAKEYPQTNAPPVTLTTTNASTTTNAPEVFTNTTVGTLAMTNPPAFSTNEVSVLTNVPPVSPPPAPLQVTNPPENPTNLLNNLEVVPPSLHPSPGND